jgi:hypothetical protein
MARFGSLPDNTVSFDLLAQRNHPHGRDYRLLRFVVPNSQNAAQMHRRRRAAGEARSAGIPAPEPVRQVAGADQIGRLEDSA